MRHRGLITVLAIVVVFLAAATFGPQLLGSAGETDGGSDFVSVTYQLTGTSRSASTVTYSDSSGNIQQATNVAVPLRRESGSSGLTIRVAHGSFVSFSAQNGQASGDLSCSIEADGQTINSGHAQGGYAIVSCSAFVP